MTAKRTKLIAILTIAFASATSLADYTVDWHTIDGGGGASSGGGFQITGTVGQPDAGPVSGPMTGGSFTLAGGYWTAFAPTCSCLGDMNRDGKKDGLDIQEFVGCLTAGGPCNCADMDAAMGVTLVDVPLFVQDLLDGNACP